MNLQLVAKKKAGPILYKRGVFGPRLTVFFLQHGKFALKYNACKLSVLLLLIFGGVVVACLCDQKVV